MKESATIAHEWVMAHYEELGIDPEAFEKNDINIHVPEGAIPKDGPSAGITMVTSIVSTYTGRKVEGADRHDGRDDPPRPGDARGRGEGEDSRGQARRHHRADPLGGEPQGYRRDQAPNTSRVSRSTTCGPTTRCCVWRWSNTTDRTVSAMFRIRPALVSDIPAMRLLFRETVLSVNRRDYTAEEVADWASCGEGRCAGGSCSPGSVASWPRMREGR